MTELEERRLRQQAQADAYMAERKAAATAHDWPQDFAHEHGQYLNTCVNCIRTFIGHKRRSLCRACHIGEWTRVE